MPAIGYGHQRGGPKKWVSRWTMRLATRLTTFSNYSEAEAERNAGIPKAQLSTIYIGVPDQFVSLPLEQRGRVVLTVGNVDQPNLLRKGHEAFVRTAALLPDVNFVLAGAWRDGAVDHLRSIATPNVTLTGWLSDEALRDHYRRAAVYVQASLHEGFGLSVAEAMLAGCVPVVSRVGSLPEVAGTAAVFVDSPAPVSIAAAITTALNYPEEARAGIRQRILDEFPLEQRGRMIAQLIQPLLNSARVMP
jgi:glycosyltransferase involved in cell wall biosynthesis